MFTLARACLASTALIVLGTSALRAEVRIDLGFNVDGQYPTQGGQPFAYDGTANTVNPSDANGSPAFSVSGGLLQQSTLGTNGYKEYAYNGPTAFTNTLNTYIEVRMRVTAESSPNADSAYVDLSNSTNRYTFDVHPNRVRVGYSSATVVTGAGFDGTQFHTYGILALANTNQFVFSIDGQNIYTGVGGSPVGANFFYFGDAGLTTGVNIGAKADYDYVRVTNAFGVVPEPSVNALLGAITAVGGAVAIRRRRGKHA